MKSFSSAIVLALIITSAQLNAQGLLTNVHGRETLSLNGKWQYVIDPYETGFYDYRFKEKGEKDPGAYWNSGVPADKTALVEHGYDEQHTLNVPGDWNSQNPVFLYYEGTVWYKKSFDYRKKNPSNRLFLYFGAVNYQADVYLNGKKLGSHKGGFTPFQFEIDNTTIKDKDNLLVVKVDNKRHKDAVPTVNTDWWNYGGITRDVSIVELPPVFVEDYFIYLNTPTSALKPTTRKAEVKGWVKLNGAKAGDAITIEIPELKIKKTIQSSGEVTPFTMNLSNVQPLVRRESKAI